MQRIPTVVDSESPLLIAAALHPRYKHLPFLSSNQQEAVGDAVEIDMPSQDESQMQARKPASVEDPPSKKPKLSGLEILFWEEQETG